MYVGLHRYKYKGALPQNMDGGSTEGGNQNSEVHIKTVLDDKDVMYVDRIVESCEGGALRLHDLDSAVIGVSNNGLLCYQHSKMLKIFMDQGMTADEAQEFIDYNVMGLMPNGKGFVMVYDE